MFRKINYLFIVIILFTIFFELNILLRAKSTHPPSSSTSPKKYSHPYSSDEAYLLSFAKSDKNAKKDNYKLITATAKKTDTIEISNCEIWPAVSEIDGQSLKIVNKDSIAHTIEADKAHSYTVESSASASVNPNLTNGVWGLSCDDSYKLSGLLYVPARN